MTQDTLTLTDRLFAAARGWVEAHDATLARLGRAVVNDTSFFARLEKPQASPTTATLEKFARYLADPVNWPANADGVHEVADEAKALAHVVGVNAPVHATSPRKSEDITPPSADAAQERVA